MSNLETLVIINSGDDGASNLIVLTLVNMHILNLIMMLFFWCFLWIMMLFFAQK